jgi:hypothetical protein
MTVILVLLALLAAGLVVRELARNSTDAVPFVDPAPPPTGRRFSGRRVEAVRPAGTKPRVARRSRLQNGSRVSAVRNGHAVTPPDAIGLGCLAPISECTLGDRCICVDRPGDGIGGHL